MNIHRFPSQVVLKRFLVVLSVIFAMQSFGINGFAAPAPTSHDFQEGEITPALTLTCSSPTYADIQIVLLIDDSGSMWTNDRQFNRDQNAKDMVDVLFKEYYLPALRSGLRSPNIEVAVIHFSYRVMESSDFMKLNPNGLDFNNYKWEEDRDKLYNEIDLNQKFPYTLEQTNFLVPLRKAEELWQSIDGQAEQNDGTLRSIILFTDGTPEEGQGPIINNRLGEKIGQLGSDVKNLPKLDGIYVIGYKVDARYFTQEARIYWDEIAKKLSTSKQEVPRVILLEGQDSSGQFEKDLQVIRTSSSNVEQVKINEALSRYKNLTVKFEDNELDQLHVDKQSNIKFRLVGSSPDNVVLPGGDPRYTLKWNSVLVAQGASESPLNVEEDRGYYQFFWKPTSSQDGQLKLEASLVDTKTKEDVLLNCSGNVDVKVRDVLPPGPVPPLLLTLVIGSPREPLDNAITVPMRLDYVGDRERLASLDWDVRAAMSDGRVLRPPVKPAGTDPGEYSLIIAPIDNAREITVNVGATTKIDGQTITIPQATTTIEISPSAPACACDRSSKFWFWPLAIVLAGLLIVLLVFRSRPEWMEKNDQDEKQDRGYRRRDWRFLFLPLLILLLLLNLNRWLWCCVIPPWLFWASILILIIIPLPMVFIPRGITTRHGTRRMMITLFPTVLLAAISVIIPIGLSWVFGLSLSWKWSLAWSLLILSLILIGRWYIFIVPPPVPSLPVAPQPEVEPEQKRDDSDKQDGLARDDLTELEGIEEEVQNLLNAMGIYTFKELVKADSNAIQDSLNEHGWNMIVPTTWPKQARLAESARQSGQELDREIFKDYLDYLKGGRIPVGSKKHAPDDAERRRRDDLQVIEGIGPEVEKLLNAKGIHTFRQLIKTDISEINTWLNERGWKMMDPRTWPRQAKLADIAREYGEEEDQQRFEAYVYWLKDGIAPQDWNKPEKNRKGGKDSG